MLPGVRTSYPRCSKWEDIAAKRAELYDRTVQKEGEVRPEDDGNDLSVLSRRGC